MKIKLQNVDLAICSLWILNVLVGHFSWNILTMAVMCLALLMRLTITFVLAKKERKAWVPLLLFAVSIVLMRVCRCYHGLGDLGDFLLELTESRYNYGVDFLIAVSFFFWIVVAPYIYYALLLYRKQLKDNQLGMHDLCGAIVWHDRKARFYLFMILITFTTFTVGISMYARICLILCLSAAPWGYVLLCRYYGVGSKKALAVLLAMAFFWCAQTQNWTVRLLLLLGCIGLVAYACVSICKEGHLSYVKTFVLTLYLGILLPSFSIGYNQFACLDYPRVSYYYTTSPDGLLYVEDSHDDRLLGLRDRFGLLLLPEYDKIVPSFITPTGRVGAYRLIKGDSIIHVDPYSLRSEPDAVSMKARSKSVSGSKAEYEVEEDNQGFIKTYPRLATWIKRLSRMFSSDR